VREAGGGWRLSGGALSSQPNVGVGTMAETARRRIRGSHPRGSVAAGTFPPSASACLMAEAMPAKL
jgi:hypothetical protein